VLLRLLAAAAALALVLPRPAGSQAGPAPARPRLVLFVSVDQMRFDYLTRFAPLYEAGLKRLLEGGAVFTSARYRHANTETGPGHAVLLSGRHARETGIIANDWYDRTARRVVNVVDDPKAVAVPGPGRGASPANFDGETVGDLLKRASRASRVVGVSLKDRAAILMAGRRADAAYWYEPACGCFGTSTYYARRLPGWLAAWNAEKPVDRLDGKAWERLLRDAAVYRSVAGEDDVKGEWDGVNTTFPHAIRGRAGSRLFYDDVRRTPFADELTLEVALLALREHALGSDAAPDLLAVSFSATDVIGHTYGPDSQEIMDQLLRLDRVLGRLLDAAEERAGRDGLLVGLSADHGVMPLVEVLKTRGIEARRVHPDQLELAVRQALATRFGAQDLIAHYEAPHFYLDYDVLQRRNLPRAEVEAEIERAMLATGLVERVYTQARLLGAAPADDPYFALVRNSYFRTRSPDLIGVPQPHLHLDRYPGGTSHGTPHDYDRHVPVAFLGPQFRPGRYDDACGPEDIAPTLAAVLGLDYRLRDEQRVLREMLSEGAGASGGRQPAR
jgi:predicted AlkP superfamily pyrophosphatase or phosphodiesterase